MVNNQRYRWDFIGLSTDTKPTSETSDKVVNGSTYYCSDTSKLYVYCDGTWYERKPLGGGGGTSNFNDLTNRPKYNGTEMTGTTDIPEVVTYTAGSNVTITNGEISATDTTYTAGSNISITNGEISATDTTYSDFTGTDGTAAGAAGLVPAPATTDAGKFLKADGTWDSAGGGITKLTTADYNWPVGNEMGIAHWLLDPGVYIIDGAPGSDVRCYRSSSSSTNLKPKTILIVSRTNDNTYSIALYGYTGTWNSCSAGVSNGSEYSEKTGELMIGSVTQSTGTSTTNVMSQNAVTSMVFADPSAKQKVQIGLSAYASQSPGSVAVGRMASAPSNSAHKNAVAIGSYAIAGEDRGIAIGGSEYASDGRTKATGKGSVAIGAGAEASTQGEFNIGSALTSYGYNNSQYRLLSGLYDGQSAHDAATVAQGNTLATSAPTTTTVGVLGQLYTDTTNMHTYQCTAIDDTTDPSNPTYTWTQRW